MATRLRDGFDFYSAVSEGIGLWTSLGVASLSATTRFGVGQSLSVPQTGISAVGSFGANCSTIFLNFAHTQAAALGTSVNSQAIRLFDGGTVQCTIVTNRNGSIAVYRGDSATLLGTYIGAFAGGGSWSHFQIKVVLSQTVGSFEIRKNGATVNDFSVTGIDNCITANEYVTSMDIQGQSASGQIQLFDDFWAFDQTVVTGEPSDWAGDTRAVQLMPNSDSAVALTPSSGGTNFNLVDELISSSADYVSGTTAPLIDEYGNGGLAVAPSAILGVTAKTICLKMDAGARSAGLRVRSGASVADSPNAAMATAAQTIAFNQDTDPNTGAAWTNANLTASIFGPRIAT